MLSRRTIIPFSAHDNSVRFIFLGNYFGHSDIVVKSVKTGSVEALVTNAMECLETDALIPYPVIELSKLVPGEYEIYSTNKTHSERSYGSFVTLTGESTYEQLETCSRLSHADADAVLESISKNLPAGPSCILYLRECYLSAKSDEDKIALAKLIMEAVSLVNRRMRGGQFMGEDEYLKDDETLLVEMGCDHVLRKDLLTNEVQQCAPFSSEYEVSLPEEDDRLYLYTEVDEQGVPFGFLLSFRPDAILYGLLKEESMDGSDLYQEAIEKAASLPAEDHGFNESEMPYLAILNELQPSSPYLHSPSISVDCGEVVVKFTEEDKTILSLFPDEFRLAMNPIETAIDETQRTNVEIPGRDFAVYAYKIALGSEDFVYWIEDSSGNIVSDIASLKMEEDYLNQLKVDEDGTRELNAKIRMTYRKKYGKHLLPFVKANCSDVTEIVQDTMTYCDSADADYQDIAWKMIEHNCIYSNMSLLPVLVEGVMKDKTIYGSYAVDFFVHKPVFKRKSLTLAMPPDSNVLYKIERYSYDGERCVDYFRSMKHEAVDYHFYDCDYAVFSAIDIRTGRSAGFLFFDFDYEQKGSVKMTRFLIDAKEAFEE